MRKNIVIRTSAMIMATVLMLGYNSAVATAEEMQAGALVLAGVVIADNVIVPDSQREAVKGDTDEQENDSPAKVSVRAVENKDLFLGEPELEAEMIELNGQEYVKDSSSVKINVPIGMPTYEFHCSDPETNEVTTMLWGCKTCWKVNHEVFIFNYNEYGEKLSTEETGKRSTEHSKLYHGPINNPNNKEMWNCQTGDMLTSEYAGIYGEDEVITDPVVFYSVSLSSLPTVTAVDNNGNNLSVNVIENTRTLNNKELSVPLNSPERGYHIEVVLPEDSTATTVTITMGDESKTVNIPRMQGISDSTTYTLNGVKPYFKDNLSATLACSVPLQSIEWLKDGEVISTESTANITESGTYSIRITDMLGVQKVLSLEELGCETSVLTRDTTLPDTTLPDITLPDTKVIRGDVDNNGKVDLNDAKQILRVALKIDKLSEQQKSVADINENGMIDLEDAKMVLKAALHIIKL